MQDYRKEKQYSRIYKKHNAKKIYITYLHYAPYIEYHLSDSCAEDNYYITAKYILDLSRHAYDLFKSSEVEEKRQLIKLILSNLRLSGKNLVFDAAKPFDLILNCSDHQVWRSVLFIKNRSAGLVFTTIYSYQFKA